MKENFFEKYGIHKFYIFIGAVFLGKILLAGMFSSDYQDRMFIPFVQAFLEHLGGKNWNVYQYYWENQFIPSFPYPPVMLLVECIGGLLLRLFQPENIFIRNLAVKLPLFFFDAVTLHYLVKLLYKEGFYCNITVTALRM